MGETTPFEHVTVRVGGDGREHIEYVRQAESAIPDWLRPEVAFVLEMATSSLALRAALTRIADGEAGWRRIAREALNG